MVDGRITLGPSFYDPCIADERVPQVFVDRDAVNFSRPVEVHAQRQLHGLDADMANAFVPQRNIGLRMQGSFADDRATYSAGVFNDWFVKAPYFVNTESFAGDHSLTSQFEVMAINGPTARVGFTGASSAITPHGILNRGGAKVPLTRSRPDSSSDSDSRILTRVSSH